uniref:GH16 domain-containing protein n=1 Tax=Macrostomum lignano TaxID=282301 RepID=A0A1I8ID15_9PLAT
MQYLFYNVTLLPKTVRPDTWEKTTCENHLLINCVGATSYSNFALQPHLPTLRKGIKVSHNPAQTAVFGSNSRTMPARILAILALVAFGAAEGHRVCLEYGLDYTGDDLNSGTITGVASAEACQRHCQLRPGCRFFSWSPPTDQNCPQCRLTCWLKSGNSKPENNRYRIAGPANCAVNEKLIFQEDFNTLDERRWQHLVTGWRGGNHEFQYYRNSRKNSYVRNGKLYIKPSSTASEYGNDFLYRGSLNLWEQGCQPDMNIDGGCMISAGVDILNPMQSARMRTSQSFSFRYGRLEVSAKMPKGDWLWPAIWMLPTDWKYGGWPMSGEIDLVEIRGNTDFSCGNKHIGNKHMGSTLHWGPHPGQNRWDLTAWTKDDYSNPYTESFHKYELEWSDSYIAYKVDDVFIGAIRPDAGGFWKLGNFQGNNLWAGGNRMAPFDQPFHLILNVAIGGDFFPDGCSNGANGAKPWAKGSPTQMREFWEKRGVWERTWGGVGNDQTAMQVDYIRVYQRV